jgi:predicted ArsR family transcriptional regulator
MADMEEMTGLTVPELAKTLGITEHAVRKRIETIGEEPISKDWLYDKSLLEKLRKTPPRGRPKKK